MFRIPYLLFCGCRRKSDSRESYGSSMLLVRPPQNLCNYTWKIVDCLSISTQFWWQSICENIASFQVSERVIFVRFNLKIRNTNLSNLTRGASWMCCKTSQQSVSALNSLPQPSTRDKSFPVPRGRIAIDGSACNKNLVMFHLYYQFFFLMILQTFSCSLCIELRSQATVPSPPATRILQGMSPNSLHHSKAATGSLWDKSTTWAGFKINLNADRISAPSLFPDFWLPAIKIQFKITNNEFQLYLGRAINSTHQRRLLDSNLSKLVDEWISIVIYVS